MTEKEALIKHMNLCFSLYRKIDEDVYCLSYCTFLELKHIVDANTRHLFNSCYLCAYYGKCTECPLRVMQCDLSTLCIPELKNNIKNSIVTAYTLAAERLENM